MSSNNATPPTRAGLLATASHENERLRYRDRLALSSSCRHCPRMFRTLLTLSFTVFSAHLAAASSTAWTESGGGAVRIVTSGLSDENGALRGALEIKLAPGWKTYWRNPGDSGIPPRIDISGPSPVMALDLHFPAPQRISDPYASWAGYTQSVALPIVFHLPGSGLGGTIEGTVSLGICESICIPINAAFSLDAGTDPDNPQHRKVIEQAFAALPEEAHDGFRVRDISRDSERLLFRADLPDNARKPHLFVATPEGLELGIPEITSRADGAVIFSADILAAPDDGDLTLEYTLVNGDDAVAGTLGVPRN